MPTYDTSEVHRIPPAFVEDPFVKGLWRAYWQQFARHGGDPDAAPPEAVATFWKDFLPAALSDVNGAAALLLGNFEDTFGQQRTSRAATEMAVTARVEEAWGSGLAVLDQMVTLSGSLLKEVQRRLRIGLPEVDWTRRALLLVHARGLQTTWETQTLLRAGFASGAWARWRTLHELSVIARFISRHGDAVAEAYLAHDEVQTLRTIRAHEKSSQTPEVWERLRKGYDPRVDELRDRFGKELFKRDYGWAGLAFPPGHFRHPRPSLEDLESEVGLGHARGVCMKANHAIHGGARGFSDNPGHSTWPPTTLLVGPSPYGIDQAAAWTAESLTTLSASYLCGDTMPVEAVTVAAIGKLKQSLMDTLSAAREGSGRDAVQEIPDRATEDGGTPE